MLLAEIHEPRGYIESAQRVEEGEGLAYLPSTTGEETAGVLELGAAILVLVLTRCYGTLHRERPMR